MAITDMYMFVPQGAIRRARSTGDALARQRFRALLTVTNRTHSSRKRKRDAPAAAVKDTPRTTIRGFLGGAKKAAVKPASVKKAGRAEKNTPRTMQGSPSRPPFL